MASSSSSSVNWLYDVFVSFRGEDVRVNFLSHFLKELDRKLITAFKDYEIEKSHSLWPELEKAIRSSRMAVVVFSENYASSSWCLNELLEIVDCKDKIIIPVFYGLDPSHVRKQIGDFGKIFEETCKNNTEEVKNQWKKALTYVANMLGFHSAKWDNEAKMIEEIAKDVLGKLLLTSSKDFENFVGIEDHMAKMSVLLQLESEEVRMVGIWGSSGIGKTTISRALFNQLFRNFQGSIFIDRAFVSETKDIYSGANPDDHNMKLHLQKKFLSEILGIKGIKIDHLGTLGQKLNHQKVLIIIDDLDDQMVLDSLVGQTQWFGSGSRIIVVTNNKHFLRAHRIDHIYEVSLPTIEYACEMLCQSAFRKNSPPIGFEGLVVKVSKLAGNLPLGLNVLGSYLRGRDKEYWMGMLPRLHSGLDDNIEKILRISYDGLGREDQAVFRHIACVFNHMEETTINSLLEESNLGVNIALENLADKSLIHIRHGHVVMHCLLQEMGKKIVGTQSIDKPGEREFLVDSKDIFHVLGEGNGTQKVLGISLDTSEIDDLHVHESAFKGMPNLRFLDIDSKEFQNEGKLHLHENFDYLPPSLKLLCWPKYPMSHMPSNFCPRNLVKLDMRENKLDKLWEGVVSLTCLKELDLRQSYNLKEIPDLSKATNLEKLDLEFCESLVELPSSIRNLNKLLELDMGDCTNLTIIPTDFNLESLKNLSFYGCSQLRTFPEFSTNISILDIWGTNIEEFPSNLHLENLIELRISKKKNDDGIQWDGVKVQSLTPFLAMLSPTLTTLELDDIPSLVELPSSFQNFNQLKNLWIQNCRNLETLPTGINLKSLDYVILSRCSRLRSFPEISTNISRLKLERTGIKEVPWWIENFSNLWDLSMERCRKLKCVSLNISKLKHLANVSFSGCGALTRVDLSGYSSEVAMEADNIDTILQEASSSLSDDYLGNFSGCGALNRVDLSGYSSEVAMEADNIDTIPQEGSSSLFDDYLLIKPRLDFIGCFKLDIDAILQQQSIIFEYMILPGEEVPSYFTHRTNEHIPLLDYGSSSFLKIPLRHVPLSPPFFRFRACAVVEDALKFGVSISLICKFKGRFGNSFDARNRLISFGCSLKKIRRGSCSVIIFDCRIPINEDNAPLAQWNYDHVDMKIDVRSYKKNRSLIVKEWGICLLEESSSPENRHGNPNTLQHVCEADKDNTVSDVEECEDSDDDSDISSETDQSEESGDSGIGNEKDQLPHVSEANEDNMPLQGLVNETEHSKDSGYSNVETERSRKRKRKNL